MLLVLRLLPAALLLTTTVQSTSFMYLPARTAVRGELACEHPEPFHYCALKRDGLFELPIGPEGYGALCPVAPPRQTLKYSYIVRPTIQWIPLTVGRKACWVVSFVRKEQPAEPLSARTKLLPVSNTVRTCDRATNDHIMFTLLDELAIEGDGTLYLSVGQKPTRDPVEVLGIYLDVHAVYE